ncbi:MAG: phosphodiester glycosidase family protein [Oscillospiraceae bacterium]|nr:phosphodiester glycosidase family protein [Oscillospiraceae bacterium]
MTNLKKQEEWDYLEQQTDSNVDIYFGAEPGDVDFETEEGEYDDEDEAEAEDAPRGSSVVKVLMGVNIAIALTISLYFIIIFTDLPIIGEARDIWIETAMTTAEHHWLATRFFPRWLIDRVMFQQIVTDEDTLSNPSLVHSDIASRGAGSAAPGSGGAGSGAGAAGAQGANGQGAGAGGGAGADGTGANALNSGESPGFSFFDQTGQNQAGQPGYQVPDMMFFGGALGGADYSAYAAEEDLPPFPAVGDVDEFGNTVIISNRAEDIYIVEIRKTGYTGRILFVSDPSRVVVRNTNKKNVQGQLIKSYLDEYDAIAGMNGNGFDDPEGHGRGGTIIGWSVADGNAWGHGAKSTYASVAFNDQNVLLAGTIKDFEAHNIRDLAQYGPSLIVDGKKLISGSGGWGLQPRTGIGQREDGTILMATFDGRQPGHSLGITAGDVADLFLQYGCVNAGLCDGGSSSVMMYDGEIVGKPSTPMKTGRYLPNAFLVLSQSAAYGSDVGGDVGSAPVAARDAAAPEAPRGRASET